MSTAILDQVDDHKTSRKAIALRALLATIPDIIDNTADPGEVQVLMEEAGVDRAEAEKMVGDFEERGRLTVLAAEIDQRLITHDQARAAAVEAEVAEQTAKQAADTAFETRKTAYSAAGNAARAHAESCTAIRTLNKPQFARFDTADEADQRRDAADEAAAAQNRSNAIAVALQRRDDAERILAENVRTSTELGKNLTALESAPQHVNVGGEIRSAKERLEKLSEERKTKAAALAKARGDLKRLKQ